jgi:hypothetical protein
MADLTARVLVVRWAALKAAESDDRPAAMTDLLLVGWSVAKTASTRAALWATWTAAWWVWLKVGSMAAWTGCCWGSKKVAH